MARVEPVETQWKRWTEKNPLDQIRHIDEEQLTKIVTQDLEYASQMDVREYTLYQKWCEVKERYPGKASVNMFGDPDISWEDDAQAAIINKVKNNIWVPKDVDDFQNLEPQMYLANTNRVDEWNAIRTFSSTMKNNSNIGRNLYYIVKDKKTNKYLGVICISSDFLDLTPRDKAIGWSRDVKTSQSMINHTAIGSTIVPLQPLGYNYMGGKLLALLCLSDKVQNDWKERYGDVLVGVTTT